jgi:excisionase family DNA binding protein
MRYIYVFCGKDNMIAENLKKKPEIAEYFSVTQRTIEDWMKAGILPYWKIGRSVRFDLGQIQTALNTKNLRNGGRK